MKVRKEIIVLGDIEMGAGTLTDDFISDKALCNLILTYAKKSGPVDIILNGDTFDFLKCPLFAKGKKLYPRYITPEISIAKLHSIRRAHHKVFASLKTFLAVSKKHRIFFNYGNHDYDLVYKWVQSELRNILGRPSQVIFGLKYEQDRVYVEHGHQYDLLNKMNFKRLFLQYQGKTILNLPWVAFGFISSFMHMKERHPFLERIQPRPVLFSKHRKTAKKIKWSSIKHFLSSILYDPFRHLFDPTYELPREIIREMIRRIRNFHWEIEASTQVFWSKKRPAQTRNKIFVFGHVHERFVEQRNRQVILQPGSWRDDYTLDPKAGTLTPRTKYYVHIQITDKKPIWELKPYPIKRSVFDFEEVLKNERKFLYLAAKEEEFDLRL